jgi:hypothetical protein
LDQFYSGGNCRAERLAAWHFFPAAFLERRRLILMTARGRYGQVGLVNQRAHGAMIRNSEPADEDDRNYAPAQQNPNLPGHNPYSIPPLHPMFKSFFNYDLLMNRAGCSHSLQNARRGESQKGERPPPVAGA